MPRNSEFPQKTPRTDWLSPPWPRLSAAAGRDLKVAARRVGSSMQIRGGTFLRPPAGGRGACFGGGGLLRWGSGLGYIFCYLFFRRYSSPPPSIRWGPPRGLRPSNPIILHSSPSLISIKPQSSSSHPYPTLPIAPPPLSPVTATQGRGEGATSI